MITDGKKKILGALIVLSALILLSMPQPATAAPENWWNENWLYRKQITISAHPENYQIRLTLDKVENFGGHCLDNMDDLRFLENQNSGVLNYWFENKVGDNGVGWVRRLENEISDVSIWVYYGNANAPNTENGNQTFALWDGFDGTALNSLWALRGGTPVVENGILELSKGSVATETIYSNWTFGLGYSVKLKAKTYGATDYQGAGFTTSSDIGDANGVYFHQCFTRFRTRSTTSTDTNNIQFFLNSWITYESARITGALARGYVRENLVATHTATIPTNALPVEIQSYSTSQILVDWVFVRKVAATEPTAILGTEEAYAPPVVFKALGKPTLLTPIDNQDNLIDQNMYFEWTIGENSENSRLEVFNNLGVCVDNQTFARPENTYIKLEGYGADNYTWLVWAENVNNANAENESNLFHFEYTGRPSGGTASTIYLILGLAGILFFILWIASRRRG